MTPRQRHAEAARLVGACALGVIAQVAVHMPQGHFGPVDEVTPFGLAYATVLVTLTATLVEALRREVRAAAWLVPLALSLNVGLFIPALASDPVISGLVVVWNLTLLTQHFFPAPGPPAARRLALSPLEEWIARSGPALRHLAALSVVLTVAVVGYRLSGRLLAQGVCLALNYGTLLFAWPFLRLLYRRGSRSAFLVALPVAGSLGAVTSPPTMLSLLAVAQSVLLLLLLGQHQSTLEVLRGFLDRPSRLIALSFASVILVGTVLLTFPAAAPAGKSVSPLDALFTATSATCVTGLIVLDTPSDFSPFGHAVILGLIQVGGLGIMVLSTFATLLLGGALGLRGERALTELLDEQTAATAYRLTRFIVLSTLAVEALGAAGLAVYFAAAGDGVARALWRGLFHAVSAFCNAGFALQSDSIVLFQERPGALAIFAALIVLGGLGFAVLSGIWSRLAGRPRRPLTTQVRVVLAASAFLVAAGAAVYLACEWGRSLAGLSAGDKLANALFQSVTLRTAGFNSVSFADLAPATLLVMLLFMFIGASPGSTGGGIKTTTAAVLLAAIRSIARTSEPVRLFDREVPNDVVYRSLAILVISAGLVALGLFLLLLFEPLPFVQLLFEVVSAFGTVGLSLGATPELGTLGKLIIIAVMFLGRIGPLTVALLLGARQVRSPLCRYPATRLMVG